MNTKTNVALFTVYKGVTQQTWHICCKCKGYIQEERKLPSLAGWKSPGWGGGHWDLRYGGISLFFSRYFGIFLEKLWYYDIGNLAVHSICNFGFKNCSY
jgi:hypothetical protein